MSTDTVLPALHVVIIDDDPIWCSLVSRILASAGFETTSAPGAQPGLAEVRRHIPDVVICDWDMPDSSGLDVLTIMQADTTLKTIPVILATASGSSVRRESAFDAGAADFIEKPALAHEIIRSVSRAILFATPPRPA